MSSDPPYAAPGGPVPPARPDGPVWPILVKTRPPLDGLSIAALICGFACCAAPVGVGLGIAGLVRTSGGRRRGRWAAVVGLVVGSLVTALLAVTSLALVVTSADDLDAADGRVGQCLDLDWADTPGAVPCSQAHDGEIVWIGRMTDALMREWDRAEYVDDFCLARDLPELYADAIEEPAFGIDYYSDAFWGEPKSGAWMICYVTAAHGKLSAPISDLVGSGATA